LQTKAIVYYHANNQVLKMGDPDKTDAQRETSNTTRNTIKNAGSILETTLLRLEKSMADLNQNMDNSVSVMNKNIDDKVVILNKTIDDNS
jgi:hypothetical protein